MAAPPPKPDSIILAVDDNSDDVDLFCLLLRKAGIEKPVQVYGHGEELLNALSEHIRSNGQHGGLPLLCFLDIRMPGVGGHQVLQWIRGHRELDQVAVIMLSSSEHPDDIHQAAIGGAQCYLAKYPQPAVLREVIEDAHRFARGAPADECFRLPSNLLLVRDAQT